MELNEAKQILNENGYIINEDRRVGPRINDLVKQVISYYNAHYKTEDRKYVERNWRIFVGFIPSAEDRKKVVEELRNQGWKVDSFYYTDEVNDLTVYGKFDRIKQQAAQEIKDIMKKSGLTLDELKDFIKNYTK
jgi:hypothetical protein